VSVTPSEQIATCSQHLLVKVLTQSCALQVHCHTHDGHPQPRSIHSSASLTPVLRALQVRTNHDTPTASLTWRHSLSPACRLDPCATTDVPLNRSITPQLTQSCVPCRSTFSTRPGNHAASLTPASLTQSCDALQVNRTQPRDDAPLNHAPRRVTSVMASTRRAPSHPR
jgi:hypothetical protein